MDWSLKLSIAYDVVCGMVYLHGRRPSPVIHGDLKTENVLVGSHFVAKICDFGLAKWKEYSRTQTQNPSKRAGTLSHTPPEILNNVNQKRTTKCDVYSFAILLYELLTEKKAFKDASNEVITDCVKNSQRPDLNELKGPEHVVGAARKCIEQCWNQLDVERPQFTEVEADVTSIRDKYKLQAMSVSRPCQRKTLKPEEGLVCSVCHLNGRIYIICYKSPTVRVYTADSHTPQPDIEVEGLAEPWEIVACSDTGRLYIADFTVAPEYWSPGRVWAVNTTTHMVTDWLPNSCSYSDKQPFRPWTMSVTSSRLLVTSLHDCTLEQYDCEGRRLKSLALGRDMWPWSAVESQRNDSFIVSHTGYRDDRSELHAVSEIDVNGSVLRRFGSAPGSATSHQLNCPAYITLLTDDNDGGGLLVADCRNSRILLLNLADLPLKEIVIDSSQVTQPHRICYDAATGELFVVHCNHVSVFCIR